MPVGLHELNSQLHCLAMAIAFRFEAGGCITPLIIAKPVEFPELNRQQRSVSRLSDDPHRIPTRGINFPIGIELAFFRDIVMRASSKMRFISACELV